MKTKTVILLFKILDQTIDKIIDEKTSEKDVKKYLYKYNYITSRLTDLLCHWKKIGAKYDWLIVTVKVPIHLQNLLEDSNQEAKRKGYKVFKDDSYWEFVRKDIKIDV